MQPSIKTLSLLESLKEIYRVRDVYSLTNCYADTDELVNYWIEKIYKK